MTFHLGDKVRTNDKGRAFYGNDVRGLLDSAVVHAVTPIHDDSPVVTVLVDGQTYYLYENCLEPAPGLPEPPTFANIAEADAWLDAQRGGTT